VGLAVVGTASMAGTKMAATGSAVGSAVAGGAGYVYEKGKAAVQSTAEVGKAVAVNALCYKLRKSRWCRKWRRG